MIIGPTPLNYIDVNIGSGIYTNNLVSARTRTGGNMMPYQCEPGLGQAVVNLYYAPGATLPTITPGQNVLIYGNEMLVFYGPVADVIREATLEEATGTYGTNITVIAYDRIAQLNQIAVRGVITSRATKNQTWEQRITTTLAPYFPAGSATFPSTGSEAHVYRLVDNNLDSTLYEQVNLACNSVGATWFVHPANNVIQFRPKGVYPTTGILFTDQPGYWNAGNAPAGAGTIAAYNMTYKTVETSNDTRNLINELTVSNVMPANMQTSDSGVLQYKQPPTTKVEALEVLEQTYTVFNATSVTNYGRRPGSLSTNLYPYRTTDSDSWYTRENIYPDPGAEYQTSPDIYSTNGQARFAFATPNTGTYYYALNTVGGGSSYQYFFGPPGGYPLKVIPTANANCFMFSYRTALSTVRLVRGIQYLDSSGNVTGTQTSGLITPTINTWATTTASFMDYTTIPSGTVAWRPFITVTHHMGSFPGFTVVLLVDDIGINPTMQTASPQFDGDTADNSTNVYAWQGGAGTSSSFRTRNILDNIGNDALTYLQDPAIAPRYLEWNVRQDWDLVGNFIPGARVDIRFNGANYRAWIDAVQWEITTENMIVKLDLSRRPASWA
jgi:hypothetical protein